MHRILASLLLAAATSIAADVSGEWEFAGKMLGDMTYVRITLKVEGNKLTGNLNELKFAGTIDGDKLNFTATRPNGNEFGTFEGVVHGDQITGTALWRKTDKVEWTAKRPARAPASPRTLDFEPKEFHRVFSEAILLCSIFSLAIASAPGPSMQAGPTRKAFVDLREGILRLVPST